MIYIIISVSCAVFFQLINLAFYNPFFLTQNYESNLIQGGGQVFLQVFHILDPDGIAD